MPSLYTGTTRNDGRFGLTRRTRGINFDSLRRSERPPCADVMRRGIRPSAIALRVPYAIADGQLKRLTQLAAHGSAVSSGAGSTASGDTQGASSQCTGTAIDRNRRRHAVAALQSTPPSKPTGPRLEPDGPATTPKVRRRTLGETGVQRCLAAFFLTAHPAGSARS